MDFVGFARRLVVDVDGSQHMGSLSDRERDRWLKAEGFRVLRFWDNTVLQDLEGVKEAILAALPEEDSPTLPRGGRE